MAKSKTNKITAPRIELPEWLPSDASVVVLDNNDVFGLSGEARVGGKPIAWLTWTHEYRLLSERPYKDGKIHGVEIERDDAGRVRWCQQWSNGQMHGPLMQFDSYGLPILVTFLTHGCGADMWMGQAQKSGYEHMDEYHEINNGAPHGISRWGNPCRPHSEEWFRNGKRHGVFREWTPNGKLLPGFPKFYLNEKPVSQAVYEAAQSKDATLPRYRKSEDNNKRSAPLKVAEAFANARVLRGQLQFINRAMKSPVSRSNVKLAQAQNARAKLPRASKHTKAKR